MFSCKYAETLMTYNKQQRAVHSELHKRLLLAFFPGILHLLCFHILIIHLDKFLLISNNNNIDLLQLGCYPVAVVILHVNKT